MATNRPRALSLPRNTTPMPPPPRMPSTGYWASLPSSSGASGRWRKPRGFSRWAAASFYGVEGGGPRRQVPAVAQGGLEVLEREPVVEEFVEWVGGGHCFSL